VIKKINAVKIFLKKLCKASVPTLNTNIPKSNVSQRQMSEFNHIFIKT